MRKLTFAGFTKQYVEELSLSGSLSLRRLAQEAEHENPRLREPLFLYAATNGKMDILLHYAQNTQLYGDYHTLSLRYPNEALTDALRSEGSSIGEEYRKVWRSYKAVCGMQARNARVKRMYREKILSLQANRGISTYRLSKELSLNNANVNAWLKNGDEGKLSLEKAQSIYRYLSTV